MRESAIERYLVKRVKETGGEAYKWISPGRRGVPDRIVMWPNETYFVEVKAERGRLSSAQKREFALLRAFDQVVCVIRSKQDVDTFVRIYTREI